MFKDVADEEDAVDGGSAAGLVHLHPLLPQTRSAVGGAAGARAAGRVPVLRVTLERPRGVLRAGLGQIGDRLEQLRGRGAADVPEERDQHAEEGREHQQASQGIDEDPVLMGDLVGEEDADLRLEVEDAGDADAGADDAQADQVVLEMVLREVHGLVAAADRGEHRDRRQGQFLEDARRVQHPHQRRAQLCGKKDARRLAEIVRHDRSVFTSRPALRRIRSKPAN